MQIQMSNINAMVADALLLILLQMSGISLDLNVQLQFWGFAGSMLAVRTIEGKIRFRQWVEVGISGIVLANILGFAWCEWRVIDLNTWMAKLAFFVFGCLSDIVLRIVREFGKTAEKGTPDVTNSFLDRIKSIFQPNKKQ